MSTVVCPSHFVSWLQELCYLCMQRSQRNVPVSLREQRQAEDQAEDKLLLLQDQQRGQQSKEQEQVKDTSTVLMSRLLTEDAAEVFLFLILQVKLDEQRQHAKRVATFNLQMCEKKEKTTCPLFPVSPASTVHLLLSLPGPSRRTDMFSVVFTLARCGNHGNRKCSLSLQVTDISKSVLSTTRMTHRVNEEV